MTVILNKKRVIPAKSWPKGTRILFANSIHWLKRPKSKAVQKYLKENWHGSTFEVFADGEGSFYVKLFGDVREIPFDDIAYNTELGLYRQSDKPFYPGDE